MKIRNGYVSNSSSSSFIIASENKKSNFKISINTDIEDLVTDSITTRDELKEFMCSYYYVSEEELEKALSNGNEEEFNFPIKKYNKLLEIINDGKTIYKINCSSEDSGISAYLYEYGVSNISLDDGMEIVYEN